MKELNIYLPGSAWVFILVFLLVIWPCFLQAHPSVEHSISELSFSDDASPEDHLARGKLHLSKGEYEAALADFTHLIEIKELESDAWYFKALVEQSSSQNSDALVSIENYLSIVSDDSQRTADGLWLRGKIYLGLDQKVKAVNDFKSAYEKSDKSSLGMYVDYSNTLVNMGETYFPEAERVLLEGKEYLGEPVVLEQQLLKFYEKTTQYQKLVQQAEKMLATSPNNPHLLKQKADGLYHLGKYTQARESYNLALKKIKRLPLNRRQSKAFMELSGRVKMQLAALQQEQPVLLVP